METGPPRNMSGDFATTALTLSTTIDSSGDASGETIIPEETTFSITTASFENATSFVTTSSFPPAIKTTSWQSPSVAATSTNTIQEVTATEFQQNTSVASTTVQSTTISLVPNTSASNQSSTELPITQSTEYLVLNLSPWLFYLIVGICAAVLLCLISVLIFCTRRKKRHVTLKTKKDPNDMWVTGNGGAEIPMVSIAAREKIWKSLESLDETETKVVVIEPSTMNVFAPTSESEANSPSHKHMPKNSTSSLSSPSVKSSSGASTKPSQSKSLTKVETPNIETSTPKKSLSDVSSASEEESDTRSETNSVFSDSTAKSIPKMGTFMVEGAAPDKVKAEQPAKDNEENALIDPLPPPPPIPPIEASSDKKVPPTLHNEE